MKADTDQAAEYSWTIKQHNNSLRLLFASYHQLVDAILATDTDTEVCLELISLDRQKTHMRAHINHLLREC